MSSEDQLEYFIEAYKYLKTCFQQLIQHLPWIVNNSKGTLPLILVKPLMLSKHVDPNSNIANIYALAKRFKNVISEKELVKLTKPLRALQLNYYEMRNSLELKRALNYLWKHGEYILPLAI